MKKTVREWAWRIVKEMREMFGDDMANEALDELIAALTELRASLPDPVN